MNTLTDHGPRTLHLARRELLALELPTGGIALDSGSIWITQDHDPTDLFLAPGQQFHPQAGRRAIAYALAPSTLHRLA